MDNRKSGWVWVFIWILLTCATSGLFLFERHRQRGRLFPIDIIIFAVMIAIGSGFFVCRRLFIKREK